MFNSFFIQIINDIIHELNSTTKDRYEINFLGNEFCFVIKKNNLIYQHVVGYNFDINTSSTALLCKDKYACSILLLNNNISSVQYKYFSIDPTQNNNSILIHDIQNYCHRIKYPVVIKDNTGSCGYDVFLANNDNDIETYTNIILQRKNAVCISKFEKIKNEYRVIYFDGNVELVYKKKKKYIIGDGVKTVRQLILEKYKNLSSIYYSNFFFSNDELQKKLSTILRKNQKLELGWKHNLSLGSTPQIIKKPHKDIITLALNAINIVGVRLASVDIIEDINGKFKIIEINGGMMMKFLSEYKTRTFSGYDFARKMYKKILFPQQ